MELEPMVDALLKGGKTQVAKALNLLESRRAECAGQAGELIRVLSGRARPERHVIGITGPPGAGKSTFLSQVIRVYRSRGKTVGILSVDPSSRRSGGALLGDRARIRHDPGDQGVFIRSMAAGSHLGGLAWRTRHCLTVLEAVYDVVLVETVGVGQSETEIEQVADTVVFLVQPGSGDALQFMKAGIMEIPHVVVVNKADQKTMARKALSDFQSVRHYSHRSDPGWETQVILASALEGWGQEEFVDAASRHRAYLVSSGKMETHRRRNRLQWVMMLFAERFGSFGVETLGGEEAVWRLVAGTDPANPMEGLHRLAERLCAVLGIEAPRANIH